MYQRLHRTLHGQVPGFTLGWGVRNDANNRVVHFGSGSGGTFFVAITIVPEFDVAVVVASNSGQAGRAIREVVEATISRRE